MKRAISSLATIAALVTATQAGAAPLLMNGSFESNLIAAGTSSFTTSIFGWTVGPDGVELRNDFKGQADYGNNYINLDVGTNSWIEQTINTIVGATYSITFSYSGHINTDAKSTNQLHMRWNNATVNSMMVANKNNVNVWTEYESTVVASSAQSTLRFLALGPQDGTGALIDGITLSLVSLPGGGAAEVPEPGAPALFGLGLALLGLSARRRRS